MKRFANKVVIVTGAAMNAAGGVGMGGATAQLLATGGATVVCADIDGDGAQRLAARIGADGGTAEGIAADLESVDVARSIVEMTVDRFGGVDIVVNVAAALGPDVLGQDRDLVS